MGKTKKHKKPGPEILYTDYALRELRAKSPHMQNMTANHIRNVNISGGAGVIDRSGRLRERQSAGRYHSPQKKVYRNRRKHIITGKELTTPIRKQRIVAYNTADLTLRQERVRIKIRTINKAKYKFPIKAVFCIGISALVFLLLVYSGIVLNNCINEISATKANIETARQTERTLENQIRKKDDIDRLLEIARNEYGMIDESMLPKSYINANGKDKVEKIEPEQKEQNSFSSVFSAVVK